MNFIEKTCPFFCVCWLWAADSKLDSMSVKMCFLPDFFGTLWFFHVSFWVFSRSRNSFSRSPTFNNHARFTLFASSGSHRHTSLQIPEATAIIFHCIHFLPILISPSHPRHSQLPPRKIPFPRPRPSFFTASTAAPAASSRWTTLSWPFCAARCSDVQPRSARRGGWSWRSSKLHGEVVFPIRNDAKAMEIFVGLATGLGSTGKPALTSHLYQQTRNFSCHSHIHPCTGPVFGPKVGTNIVAWQWWTSKVNLWYRINTGNIHKKNWKAKKMRSKGCEEGGLKRCPFSYIKEPWPVPQFQIMSLCTLNLVYWSRFLFNIKMHSPSFDTATTTHHSL